MKSMAPTLDGGDARYKLSKPLRSRISDVSPSSGGSRSDLEFSTTKDFSTKTTTSADAFKPRYRRRSVKEGAYGDGHIARKESDSEGEDALEIARKTRKRSLRSNTTQSKGTSMRLSLGLGRTWTHQSRDELADRETDEDLSVTIKRKADKDKLEALNRSSETISDEYGLEERFISPIRRRSFFTPGLATRNPANVLAKPPKRVKKQEQVELEYYYNPRLSVTSPLGRIAALDLADRPITPLTRCGTPGDLDYGLIGRLRITNGTASPAPSVCSHKTIARRSFPVVPDFLNHPRLPVVPSWLKDPGSPVEAEVFEATGMTHAADVSLNHDSKAARESLLIYEDVFGPPMPWVQAHDNYEFEFKRRRSKSCSVIPFQDKTLQIAQDYMTDLAPNPFRIKTPEVGLLGFQATTKPNEFEAELFDEASLKEKYSHENIRQLKLSLPDLVAHDDFEKQTSRLLARIGNSCSTLNTLSTELGSQKETNLNVKTDSGYNSASSTDSYRKYWAYHGTADTLEVSKIRRTDDLDHDVPSSTAKDRRRPTPVTIPTSSTVFGSVFTSMQSSTDTIPTLATFTSTPVDVSQPVTPKKLQKSRRKSQPLPSKRVDVQMHPELEATSVPYVPEELTTRMARRVADLPPLEHTLPSIGHLRLEKEDLIKAPLSAPLRFPSPQPPVDKVWDQVMELKSQRQKAVRARHSTGGALQSKSSERMAGDRKRQTSNMISLNDVDNFLRGSSHTIDNTEQNIIPLRSGPVLSPRMRNDIPRTDSVPGLTNHEAAEVSRVRSMANNTSTRTTVQPARIASSVYTDASPALASSVWTDATPELRQISSSYNSVLEPSLELDTKTTSILDKHAGESTIVPNKVAPTPLSISSKSHKARTSSNDKTIYDPGAVICRLPKIDSSSKGLPPLPAIPPVPDRKARRSKSKSVDVTQKALPPLPHQRKTSDHIVPRGLSPCRESGIVLMESGTKVLDRPSKTTTSVTSPSRVNNELDYSAVRSSRMRSEPPVTPSSDLLPTIPQLGQFSSPQSTPSTDTQQLHLLNQRAREIISPSPDERYEQAIWTWTSATTSPVDPSPERSNDKWRPPRPESLQRRYTDWHQRIQSSSPSQQHGTWDDEEIFPDLVPRGLNARLQGHFKEGLFLYHDSGSMSQQALSRTGPMSPEFEPRKTRIVR